MRVLAADLKAAAQSAAQSAEQNDEEAEVSGWVHRLRSLGGVSFVVLRDRSGLCQLVLSEGASELTPESVITVTGRPALNEKAPGGAELHVHKLEVLSKAAIDLPFQVNADVSKIGLESVLDNRILSMRNPKIRAIFRVQATIIEAFSQYLRSHGFTEIKSSKLVWGGTEGGTELFKVEYFDRTVCLAQSPQFYKETMVASGLERVFEVAPAYRAEKHDTPRHLNEYVSMDVEMGFIDSEMDLIELDKGILTHVFASVGINNSEDLALWGASVPDAASVAASPVISYQDAVTIANDERARTATGGAKLFDINPEAERLICEWSAREAGSGLVFVNEFPRRYRPFYTYPKGSSGTMSFDALFRGLEITTGGRRLHDYNAFLEVLPKFGLKAADFEGGYITLLKYGCPPHGGFAIGCERLTQKILGLANVKEASLFPRDRKRVSP
jgi:nondiscriminating aspartyl-tRNA synthetase